MKTRFTIKLIAACALLVSANAVFSQHSSHRPYPPAPVPVAAQAIGLLKANLGAEHLQTHLAQTALLTTQQVALYQSLRGYDNAAIPMATFPR